MVVISDAVVPAGFPSPALDYLEERLSLDELYIPRPLSTFIVNVQGDSMVNAFIPPKARLVVDRSLTAKHGDIVLAEASGEFTVKFLKIQNNEAWLVPANPKYSPIAITEEKDVKVWGVVTSIITETKDLRGRLDD